MAAATNLQKYKFNHSMYDSSLDSVFSMLIFQDPGENPQGIGYVYGLAKCSLGQSLTPEKLSSMSSWA